MPRSPEFQKKLDQALDVSKKLYRLVAARNEMKPARPSTPTRQAVKPWASVTPADKLPEVLWKDVPKGSRIVSIELPPIKK